MTKKREEQIDVFHRKLIRENVLHIFYPKIITNDELYRKTGCKPWSAVVKTRRLKWFGHLMRLPPDTPVRKALRYATEHYVKPRGRPKTTWLAMFKKELLLDFGLSWENACRLAADRDAWKRYT